jgi:hypothetical protein
VAPLCPHVYGPRPFPSVASGFTIPQPDLAYNVALCWYASGGFVQALESTDAVIQLVGAHPFVSRRRPRG